MRAEKPGREFAGLIRFSKETLMSFGLALVFIVYVVQAFRIPSESMEDSLLIGDQLLALKFSYGAPVLPFTYAKFPGIKDPEPGEAVIFKSPNNQGKDYIKRCVAGPGQTVEIRENTLVIDGQNAQLPPEGKHVLGGRIGDPEIENFAPVRIPAQGDLLVIDSLTNRETLFAKHLIKQEHPRTSVELKLHLYIDGEYSNAAPIKTPQSIITLDQVNAHRVVDKIDNWIALRDAMKELSVLAQSTYPGKSVEVRPVIYRAGEPVSTYRVENDNYFMMGDNRDNSADSRYWGFLNRNYVKAKAFILYFSLDKETPYWQLPLKIRWNRIGKLIRAWDGQPQPVKVAAGQ